MLCVKGIGKDHAKFSPVGERETPSITLDGLYTSPHLFPLPPSHCFVPPAARDHTDSTSDRIQS